MSQSFLDMSKKLLKTEFLSLNGIIE